VEPLNDLVLQWRAAIGADRDRLAAMLLEVARGIAQRAARGMGLASADAQDVAQDVLRELFAFLDTAAPFRRNADAYVWWLAENRTRDWLRAAKRRRVREEQLLQEAAVAPSTSQPLAELLERERLDVMRARVRQLIVEAPPNYRNVLERRLLDGELIEEIAEDEFRQRVARGEVNPQNPAEVTAARRAARNLIDQRLTRARRWLETRLAREEGSR
jgi:RNA polymerase sigma factor (sigma-70 family)